MSLKLNTGKEANFDIMDKDNKIKVAIVTLLVNLEPKDGNWDKMFEQFA